MFETRFQTFDDANEREASAARLAALRAELKRRGLDGFIVPRADRHQGEYVPPSEERLRRPPGFPRSGGGPHGRSRRAAQSSARAATSCRYAIRSTPRSSPSSISSTLRPTSGSRRT